jgi:hypothetical protein
MIFGKRSEMNLIEGLPPEIPVIRKAHFPVDSLPTTDPSWYEKFLGCKDLEEFIDFPRSEHPPDDDRDYEINLAYKIAKVEIALGEDSDPDRKMEATCVLRDIVRATSSPLCHSRSRFLNDLLGGVIVCKFENSYSVIINLHPFLTTGIQINDRLINEGTAKMMEDTLSLYEMRSDLSRDDRFSLELCEFDPEDYCFEGTKNFGAREVLKSNIPNSDCRFIIKNEIIRGYGIELSELEELRKYFPS